MTTPGRLYDELVGGRHSLAVNNDDQTLFFDGRGIADLHRIYTTDPDLLRGGTVADKVVGKGAAALIIAGGAVNLYAGTISKGALSLLKDSEVKTGYGKIVDHIVNRTGDGWCPVERLCRDCATAAECLPLINEFINQSKK